VSEGVSTLLTDVVMPKGSGKEPATRWERWSGIKVLFMSGHVDDATVRHGLPTQSQFHPETAQPQQLPSKPKSQCMNAMKRGKLR
jgi:hypothetical protein